MVQGSAHHPLQIIAGNGGTKLDPTLGPSGSYSCDQKSGPVAYYQRKFIGDRQSFWVVGAVVCSYGYAVGRPEGNGAITGHSHFNHSAGLSSSPRANLDRTTRHATKCPAANAAFTSSIARRHRRRWPSKRVPVKGRCFCRSKFSALKANQACQCFLPVQARMRPLGVAVARQLSRTALGASRTGVSFNNSWRSRPLKLPTQLFQVV
jgi:hypothetical protein